MKMAKSDRLKGFQPGFSDSGKAWKVGSGATGGPWDVALVRDAGTKPRLGGDTQSKHAHARKGTQKNIGSRPAGVQPKKKFHPE